VAGRLAPGHPRFPIRSRPGCSGRQSGRVGAIRSIEDALRGSWTRASRPAVAENRTCREGPVVEVGQRVGRADW